MPALHHRLHGLRFIAVASLAFAIVAAMGSTVLAGPIAWGTARTIFGESDVVTSGTLVYAYRFSNSLTGTATVNGVPFQPFTVPYESESRTVGDVTLTAAATGAVMYPYDVLTSENAPFSELPSSYQDLLSGAVIASIFDTPNGAPLTIELGGLTPGDFYLVQWWSSATSFLNPYQTVALGSPNVSLDSNTTDAAGGLGQYAVGSFTALGSSQTITLEGLMMNASPWDAPTINALQLRVAAVPEPSTYAMALAALACGGVSAWWRRKRA